MHKRLERHGDSYALVVDQPILDSLRVDASTLFEVTSDGERLVLIPIRDNEDAACFDKTLEAINKRYSTTLKKLADG